MKGVPAAAERLDRGADDLVDRALLQFGRQHRSGAVGAHAAGVGAGIAVADALVILCAAEGDDGLPVAQHEQAGFLALQELLDHGIAADPAPGDQRVERGFGLVPGLRDRHALAGGEAVVLDDYRIAEFVERGACAVARSDAGVARGGDAEPRAQILGEALGAFQLRCIAAGAEYGDAHRADVVRKPVDQRRFGPDDDEFDRVAQAEIDHAAVILRVQRREFGIGRGARIAGRGVELFEPRRLRQPPCQRMFTATRSE